MDKIIKFFLKKIEKLDQHSKDIIIKSIPTTFLKVIGMLIGFFLSIFLGRNLGAEGLGVISLANQITNVALIFSLLGMRQIILKEISIGYSRKEFTHVQNVIGTSIKVLTRSGVITLILLISLSNWLSNSFFDNSNLEFPLIIASIGIIPMIYTRIYASAINGFQKIWQSNLADQTLSVAVTFLLLIILYFFKYNIDIYIVAIAYLAGKISVTLVLKIYWNSIYKNKQSTYEYIGKYLKKSSFPLFISTSTASITSNANILILAWLSDSMQVGVFSVALRIALLTSFFLLITNSTLAPKIASLFANNQKNELEHLLHNVSKWLSFIGLLSVLFFGVFGEYILTLWGSEFSIGYEWLIILSIGQFFNIATGPSGLVLVLCGHEKAQTVISIIFLFLGVILNIILIKYYEGLGAAIATSVIIALENISKVIYAKKFIGITTIKLFIKS